MLILDNLLLQQDDFELRADLQVAADCHTALIGPSGAGKSTLLSALAGFLPPAYGRIIWDGRDITSMPPGDRPLSILFQDQNLFPHLSLAQNLGLGINPKLRLARADHGRIEQALVATGLDGLGARKPGALSGGQQSRAALARALLRARPLLLLDEPFSALGPALKTEMLDLTRRLCRDHRMTLLMVTHEPADARALCPQTCVIANGRVAAPAPTAALLDNPPPALKAYLGP
ncbi:ATP-binding cassette domain-containing protein [Rhodobacteraceae bacterium]|nr:ATP-binding cassette domain-containing protein [Paracoccaceae bacterium]